MPKKPRARIGSRAGHPNSVDLDLVGDARARHEAEKKRAEAELSADPVFRTEVAHGERWDKAKRAAIDAAAPYRAEIDKLIASHPAGYARGSEASQSFDALNWAAKDAEAKAYALAGFQKATAPKSPHDLLARLKRVELNWWFDLQEAGNLPRPSELLWQKAEGLREQDPFLPPLPLKPDAGRERYAVLVRWCDQCIASPSAVAELDDGGYRPATCFPKGMAARLRMAAQKSRKSKRVATRTIDGVVCYSVADARRWWPKDVPGESKKA